MKCPTHKRQYDNKAEADSELNIIGPAYGDFLMKSYRCPLCGFWHHGHSKGKGKPTRKMPDPNYLTQRFNQLLHATKPDKVAERNQIISDMKAMGLPIPRIKKSDDKL